jgi:hypothetical protein
MTKATLNALFSGLSGSLDKDHYVRQTKDGRTIISKKPDFSNRQFSEGQLDVQSGMKAAAAYAKVASKDNPIYAKVAEGTAKNAYNVAIGDWFNAPVIRSMDLCLDGLIRVSATDDVQVTKVIITILDQEGKSLEQGEAELTLGAWWDYKAVNRGRIQVEAWDMAGNVTRREFEERFLFARFQDQTT